MKFYGRKEELTALRKEICKLNIGSRLAVITGRRRVGKTTLILKACQDSGLPYVYFYVQRKYSEEELAKEWLFQIRSALQLSEDDGPARLKLSSIIRYVMQKSMTQPMILVIDECQELDFINESFWSELQQVWDLNKNNSKLFLVMSGSIVSALRHIFGSISEPLYGRTDLTLTVQPFAPNLIKEIFFDINSEGKSEDLLSVYTLTGGVARYIEILTTGTTLETNSMLDFVFSPSGSSYRADGDIVLANEFRIESGVYYALLRAIASGATKWSELQNAIGGQIGPYLNRLENQYGLIKRIYPLGTKSGGKNVRYSIADEYFRFWFRYIDTPIMKSLEQSQQWEMMRKLCEKDFVSLTGRCLENWFRLKYLQSGQWTEVGTWWDKRGGNAIDLVAVNALEKQLEFAEIKRQSQKINMTLLSQKVDVFLQTNPNFKNFEVNVTSLSLKDL